MDQMTKRCHTCGETKLRRMYRRDPAQRDGHRRTCKQCDMASRRAYRERTQHHHPVQPQAVRPAYTVSEARVQYGVDRYATLWDGRGLDPQMCPFG